MTFGAETVIGVNLTSWDANREIAEVIAGQGKARKGVSRSGPSRVRVRGCARRAEKGNGQLPPGNVTSQLLTPPRS